MTQEAWLRGPVEGVIPELQPVAHALIQAREDVERIVPMLSAEELWTAPGAAASPGFHLRHLAGSTDRLLTYASGRTLSREQKRYLATEKEPQPDITAELLLQEFREVFDAALAHLRSVDESELDEERLVGRSGLASNVRGLLFHMGEHATRHVGQLITTLNMIRDRPIPSGPTAVPSDEKRTGHAPGGALPDASAGPQGD
jgi:uncharacterized damage-inducible protein DinB